MAASPFALAALQLESAALVSGNVIGLVALDLVLGSLSEA
jgi:hypothetical protein